MFKLNMLHQYCKQLQNKGFTLMVLHHEVEHLFAQVSLGVGLSPQLIYTQFPEMEIEKMNMQEEALADIAKAFLSKKECPKEGTLYGGDFTQEDIKYVWGEMNKCKDANAWIKLYSFVKSKEKLLMSLFKTL